MIMVDANNDLKIKKGDSKLKKLRGNGQLIHLSKHKQEAFSPKEKP